jgi:hypothetical protein
LTKLPFCLRIKHQQFAAQRRNERELFIGTQFSNLYTALLVAVGKMEMEKLNGCVCHSTAKDKAAAKVAVGKMELEKLNGKQLGAQQKTKEVADAAKVVVYYIQSSKSHNHPHRQGHLGRHTDQDKYHGPLRFCTSSSSSSSSSCAMKETCKMYKVHASTS